MSVIVHPLLVNSLFNPRDSSFHPCPLQSFDNNLIKPIEKIHDLNGSLPDFIHEKIEEGSLSEGFFVFNYTKLINQYLNWKRLLPRVEPFYAVKCNPMPAIIRFLASMGIGFDCASAAELKLIKDLDVPSSQIIFANACKLPSHIRYAKSIDVNRMTFDNLDELKKIKINFPDAELILRILPDDSQSLCRFGSKYGAAEDVWPTLFEAGKEMGLNIIGISYHVGSGCYSANSFADAIFLARRAFDLGLKNGFNMKILDIGGGFSGTQDAKPSFEEVAKLIAPLLDEVFPNIKIIAEPGRYFAASTMTLVSTVHSRRRYIQDGCQKYLYYIDEGVYGSFNCIIFDHQMPRPKLLTAAKSNEMFESTLFGPSCDSLDVIAKEYLMPELEVGDWLMFENMGAYTTCAASEFNGFRTTMTIFVKEAGWS
jgi:ornithine decarboxylase